MCQTILKALALLLCWCILTLGFREIKTLFFRMNVRCRSFLMNDSFTVAYSGCHLSVRCVSLRFIRSMIRVSSNISRRLLPSCTVAAVSHRKNSLIVKQKPQDHFQFSIKKRYRNHAPAEEIKQCDLLLLLLLLCFCCLNPWCRGDLFIIFEMLVACFFLSARRSCSVGLALSVCDEAILLYSIHSIASVPMLTTCNAHTLLCYFIAHVRLTVIHLLYILWIFSH